MPASPFGLGLARFALLAHIEIIFADLAIERRAANAETTRHFTHMAFIEVDGILKDIALDYAFALAAMGKVDGVDFKEE